LFHDIFIAFGIEQMLCSKVRYFEIMVLLMKKERY